MKHFDPTFYTSIYPDIPKDPRVATQHYITYGVKENRIPSKFVFYQFFPAFDWKFYTTFYTDLEKNELFAIAHYINNGRHEGREINNSYSKYIAGLKNKKSSIPVVHEGDRILGPRKIANYTKKLMLKVNIKRKNNIKIKTLYNTQTLQLHPGKLLIYRSKNYCEIFLDKKMIYMCTDIIDIEFTKSNDYPGSLIYPVSGIYPGAKLEIERSINAKIIIQKTNYPKMQQIISHTDNLQTIESYVEIDKQIVDSDKDYIFVHQPSEFEYNRGYCKNIGSKLCLSNNIVFIDIDILLPKFMLDEMLHKLNTGYDIVTPYKDDIIYIDKKQKDYLLKQDIQKLITDAETYNKIIQTFRPGSTKSLFTVSGGITGFKRSSFAATGGFEEINGYGYEDRFMDVIIEHQKLSTCMLDNTLIHLYHPKPDNPDYKKTEFSKEALRKFNSKYYNCFWSPNCKTSLHEHCNHSYDALDPLIERNKKLNGNLRLFYDYKCFDNIVLKPFNIKIKNTIPYKQYNEYLSGKKVAIIGPSPSVMDVANGYEIEEEYDVIVRCNKAWDPIYRKDIYEYTGKRTDVLYNCLNPGPECGGYIDIDKLKKLNLKYIVGCFSPTGWDPTHRDVLFHDELSWRDYANFYDNNQDRIPFVEMDPTFYDMIDTKINTRINTGAMAMLHLMNSPAKHIYMTGFTFFMDGYIEGYRDIVWGEKAKRGESGGEQVVNAMLKHGHHEQEPQMKIVREMYRKNKHRVTLDTKLHKILNTNMKHTIE